jgi:phosphoserine aminotransferase
VAVHRLKGNKEAQAKFLASWSKKAYSYTAEVEQNFDELNINEEDSPCAEQFSDVTDVSVDGQRILKFCQNHNCSGYCLKCFTFKKRKRTEKRVCRAGAGEE